MKNRQMILHKGGKNHTFYEKYTLVPKLSFSICLLVKLKWQEKLECVLNTDRENGGKDAQTFVYRDELWLEYQMEGMPLEFSQAINSKSSYTTKTD